MNASSSAGSLRRRLVLALLAVLVLGGALASAGLYALAFRQQGEVFDERLRALSFNLPVEAMLQMPRSVEDETAEGIVVQIWRRDGVLLWSSGRRPAPISTQIGMVDLEIAGERWRSFTRLVRDDLVLQVSQDLEARERRAAAEALRLLVPLLVLLPVLALVGGWIVSVQLEPLRRLATLVQSRGTDDHAPVVLAQAPRELSPVLASLNDLLSRQAHARRRQREFLADAAHELRTPLAAVRLQAQHAEAARTADERGQALVALRGGVDRATHLVAQLLDLARSEGKAGGGERAEVALDRLAREVVAQRHPLATARGIDLGVEDAQGATVLGEREALASLLGNLVDNAIAYTPAPGRIDVGLRRDGAWADLRVEDTGPGIAPERRAHLFDRFARGGRGDVAGTGLGLAIALRVAHAHGGTIELRDRSDGGSGLCAVVRLPLVSSGSHVLADP
ncbi:MAG: integral rane sensor signal transduction histidine kinase [Panacagrimonas sp.]|jgi:two-component system OmpR family sensor kinase|nr:HAMP domain-containing sensor histidine kinase [Panacagrimonas sp.]MCC2657012.1 integral rane sensor signal transduction histidine kinase [Panacagrimonas sp.]